MTVGAPLHAGSEASLRLDQLQAPSNSCGLAASVPVRLLSNEKVGPPVPAMVPDTQKSVGDRLMDLAR